MRAADFLLAVQSDCAKYHKQRVPTRNSTQGFAQSPEIELLAARIRGLVAEAGGRENLITPRGYRHLGLAIVDSVFSLRARYDRVVVPLLIRYSNEVSDQFWMRWDDESLPEHKASDVLRQLDRIGDRGFEVMNRQKVMGVGGVSVHKLHVVRSLAKKLVDVGGDSIEEFHELLNTKPEVERQVRSLSGVGDACWRYLLNLTRMERVKPDTRVVAWVERAIGRRLGGEHVAELVETAVLRVRPALDVTIRQIDHLIWRKESGRQLGKLERGETDCSS